ncbi:hypothetical protein KL920_005071 [Ogataea angusta]|nr:hypothetical protein KL920_005071 [Ogataea angusta]
MQKYQICIYPENIAGRLSQARSICRSKSHSLPCLGSRENCCASENHSRVPEALQSTQNGNVKSDPVARSGVLPFKINRKYA